jgi:hypothetical protein
VKSRLDEAVNGSLKTDTKCRVLVECGVHSGLWIRRQYRDPEVERELTLSEVGFVNTEGTSRETVRSSNLSSKSGAYFNRAKGCKMTYAPPSPTDSQEIADQSRGSLVEVTSGRLDRNWRSCLASPVIDPYSFTP